MVWYIAGRIFNIKVLNTILHPLIASVIIVFVSLGINQLHFNLILSLVSKIVSGIAIYFVYSLYFSRSEVNWFIEQVKWLAPKK